ncbi:MAG: methionine--tRNA ligase [Planctomycetia bacterium]|nr:methionine--tRNA ligase [Planctomycetia bacterium]
MTSPRRVLITAALPYANDHPHLGHVAGVYLPADTYNRYLRLKGVETVFICGSDDHGVPVTISAQKENCTPTEVVARYRGIQEKVFSSLGVEFDHYSGTSTCEGHAELSQEFFSKILEAGDIEENVTDQFYCESCDMFLPDRYVEGTCPHCEAEGARGDQCDGCGQSYEQSELDKPHCAICESTPRIVPTKHWFFRLDRYEDRLEEWLEGCEGWRDNVRNFARGIVREGLPARSITRDLEWGVPVPLEEAKDKVLYVWFDAPIGYISFTKEHFKGTDNPEEWREWWSDKDVELVHFLGKDNIIFHAVIWPAMLMGQGEFNLPTSIPANEYLNFMGQKFSKSRGVGVTAEEILESFDADRVRYYLTTVAPEGRDTSFTWEDFIQRNNDELSDVVGNFAHRMLTFTAKNFESKVPEGAENSEFQNEVLQVIREAKEGWDDALDRQKFREGLEKVLKMTRQGNRLFDQAEPWKSRKSDLSRCGADLAVLLELVYALAVLLKPYLPTSSEKLLSTFVSCAPSASDALELLGTENILRTGCDLHPPGIIFPRLELPEDGSDQA